MVFLDPILNPVFMSLMNKSPVLVILLLSLFISVLITLVYKYFTNQTEMKRLKEQQKEFSAKMKALKDRPEEMMQVQKEAMKVNMQYMKHSFKSTLITMLPIILIFGWMNGHFTSEPIYPLENYELVANFKEGISGTAQLVVDEKSTLLSSAEQNISDGKALWRLKSEEGEHFLTVKIGDDEQNKKVLITTELKTEEALTAYKNSDITSIQINYKKLKPLGASFSLFGWYPGWLSLYIISSLVFSMALRKFLNIY